MAAAGLIGVVAGCGEVTDRSAAADGAPHGSWFEDVTSAVGLDFVHESGATGQLLLPEIMGGGAALFDSDGDGDLDLYLVNGNTLAAEAPVPPPVNRLYRQEAGGRFTDVTAESGLGDTGLGMGVAIGDIDNDGDADVYVTNYGPDVLYRNRGDGTFEPVTGVGADGWSCSAAFVDYDRDGWLDLYVTRYVAFDPKRRCFNSAGRPDYCGPKVFTPVADVLLRNTGLGEFVDVSEQAGIASVAAAGLGVVCEDLDGDGLVDIYVANDAYPNHLWINAGDGTFRDDAVMLGAAYNLHGMSEAGMGVIASDLNNDALPDLFVTHLSDETNTLYRNLGPGFLDVTGASGLGESSVRYTGFGVAALDVELDGDADLLVANGRVNRLEPLDGAWMEPPWDVLAEPNLAYVNGPDGVFTPACGPAAAFCRPIEISRGLAVGDIDADGDLDVLVANIQGPARLYRNEAPRRGHWLSVRAVDPRLSRDALGATITLICSDDRFVQTTRRASSYLSSGDPRAHYGLGDVTRVQRIEVAWPDGVREAFPGTDVDRMVILDRGSGKDLP